MNIHAHTPMMLHTACGEASVGIFWRQFFADDNTYAVQFFLHFPDIVIDCIYCFTDGFTHTMIVNTDPVLDGELYKKVMPLFVDIYKERNLFE